MSEVRLHPHWALNTREDLFLLLWTSSSGMCGYFSCLDPKKNWHSCATLTKHDGGGEALNQGCVFVWRWREVCRSEMLTWAQLLDFVLWRKKRGSRRTRGSWRSRSYTVSEARYQDNKSSQYIDCVYRGFFIHGCTSIGSHFRHSSCETITSYCY